MAQLRVYLPIENLQTQMAAFLGAPTTARGYVPLAGSNSLIIEIAPGMTIHRVIDLAMKSIPSVEPGLLFVERSAHGGAGDPANGRADCGGLRIFSNCGASNCSCHGAHPCQTISVVGAARQNGQRHRCQHEHSAHRTLHSHQQK